MGYILELRKILGPRPLIITGSCVIVKNDQGQILLQKRTDTLDWGTIGGSLELGDSFEEAAARELFEETGLRADKFKFVTVLSGKDMYFKYPHGDEVYNVMAVFEAEGIRGEPKVNDNEGLELGWFSLNEPIEGINPFTKRVLRKLGYIKE